MKDGEESGQESRRKEQSPGSQVETAPRRRGWPTVFCAAEELDGTVRLGTGCSREPRDIDLAWAHEKTGKEELEVMIIGSSQDQFFKKGTGRQGRLQSLFALR